MVTRKANQRSNIGASLDESPGYSESDEVAVLKAMLAEYQANDRMRQIEVERLGGVLQQLTQVNSIECILANGFEELSAKLGPLQDLAPKREPLDDFAWACLESVKQALAKPNWSGATTLPVERAPIPHIGTTIYIEGSMAS